MVEQIRTLLPENRKVLSAAEATLRYGNSTTGLSKSLAGAVYCETTEDVQSIMRWSFAKKISVHVISTGKNWGYGCALPVEGECLVIDLSRMNKIREFNPEQAYVNVEPGVTQKDLGQFLDQKKFSFMVPVTGAGPNVSLLANALERGYGITPYCDHFKAVLSLEAVLPDGTIYRSAGRELKPTGEMGHVWGLGPYMDGLFGQSGLGIVTSMTILLYKKPEVSGALVFEPREGLDISKMIPEIQNIIRDYPGIVGGLNLMNQHRVLAMVSEFPKNDVDEKGLLSQAGLEKLSKQHQIKPWSGIATIYGTKGVVKSAIREINQRLKPFCSRVIFFTPEKVEWIKKISAFLPKSLQTKLNAIDKSLELVQGRPNSTALPLAYWKYFSKPDDGKEVLDPTQDGCGLLWYSPIVPISAPEFSRFMEWVQKTLIEHGREPLVTLTTISDRCFDSTIPILFDRKSAADQDLAQACLLKLLQNGVKEGFVPYRLGVNSMDFMRTHKLTALSFYEQIKGVIDPDRHLLKRRYEA